LIKQNLLNDIIEEIIFFPMRIRLCFRSRGKNKIRQQTIHRFHDIMPRFELFSANNHKVIFNVALYLLLLDQDLEDFTDTIIEVRGNRKRILIARHEAILLYEASEDMRQLLGREFRKAIRALGVSAYQSSKLNQAASRLNEYWLSNREFLSNIRNVLAAHREQDAIHYLENLELIKPLDVMKRAADLTECMEELAGALVKIILEASGFMSILLDKIASNKT